jgi:hypothetical protein
MTDTDASGSLGGQQPVVDPLDNTYLHGASASLAGWLRKTFYLSEPIAKRISEANKTAEFETHGQEPAGYKAALLLLRELKASSQKHTASTKVKKDSVTETIRLEERNLTNTGRGQ